MNEWIESALRVITGAVVAGLLGTLGATLRSTARLRRELVQDVQLLAQCPPGARGLLADSVSIKTKRLIAYERFPSLVAADLMRLAIAVGLPLILALTAVDLRRESVAFSYSPDLLMSVGIYHVIVGSQWYAFHTGFVWRANDRMDLLEKWDVAPHPDERQFWDTVRAMASTMFGGILLVAPPIFLFRTLSEKQDWPEKYTLFAILFHVIVLVLVLFYGLRAGFERPISASARRAIEVQSAHAAGVRRRDKRKARKRDATSEGSEPG